MIHAEEAKVLSAAAQYAQKTAREALIAKTKSQAILWVSIEYPAIDKLIDTAARTGKKFILYPLSSVDSGKQLDPTCLVYQIQERLKVVYQSRGFGVSPFQRKEPKSGLDRYEMEVSIYW